MGSRWTAAALDLLFPPRCLVCDGETASSDGTYLICDTCRREMFTLGQPQCPKCAAPIPAVSMNRPDCPRCRTMRYQFEGTTALGVYRGVLREQALRMKRPREEPLTLALGKALGERARRQWPESNFATVTPIPMSLRRRWVRGVNGPELLAEAVAQMIGAPVRHALKVKRHHVPQSTLPASKRRDNVRGAFQATRVRLQGECVLLVDDILTTGQTASEAARVLRAAGAKAVCVAVVARSIGES